MRRVLFIFLSVSSAACSVIAGVDWDRVQASSGGTLPDGAPIPPGDDGSSGNVPSGQCPSDQVECLKASGVACCARNDDVGVATFIAAAAKNTCAVTSTGHVRCWGSNATSQLGRGQQPSMPKSNKPQTVFRIPGGATTVTVGSTHVCAIVDSLLACWGGNNAGQLGTGGTDLSPLPVVVPTPAAPDSVGAGDQATCASLGGTGYCWGDNGAYEAGNETDKRVLTPKLVTGLGPVAKGGRMITAGGEFSCAAATAGLACWGNNSSNRLGTNAVSNIGKATAVLNGSGVAADIMLGDSHACAIRGGALLCWGSNLFGQLGDDSGTSFPQSTGALTPPGMDAGISSVCAGFSHTCAIKNGGVWCTGQNSQGQTASTTGDTKVFVQVKSVTSATQLACGPYHTCALLQGGAIKCWGSNDNGQLGDGTDDTSAASPRDVAW
jgi:alpha-tubulin suppressor-like RCC1 family protein